MSVSGNYHLPKGQIRSSITKGTQARFDTGHVAQNLRLSRISHAALKRSAGSSR
jgi:hypothetical protein